MTVEELLSFLNKRQGLLDGVAFTGGEPCLQKDLPELLETIKGMGYKIKLDTNGNHPDMLEKLLELHLVDYVAMDIKNSPEQYARTVGLKEIDLTNIRRSVCMLLEDRVDYEFRTTVVEQFHEEKDFEAIGQMIQGAKRYFLQAFTDRDSVPFGNLSAPSKEAMLKYSEIAGKYVQDVQIRGVDL